MVIPSPMNITITLASTTITPPTPMPTTPWDPEHWEQKISLRSLKRSAVFCVSTAAVLVNDILDKAKISFSDQLNLQCRFTPFSTSLAQFSTAFGSEVLTRLKAVDFAASAPTG